MEDKLFMTMRNKVLALYEKADQPFIASTQPYHSTQVAAWQVVDFDVGDAFAYAVLRRNTQLNFFTYGIGGEVNDGRRAREHDTNLAKGNSTNGAADFVIEGVGLHTRGLRVTYVVGTNNFAGFAGDMGAVDADVVASLSGDAPIFDPAAIVTPPQMFSPFNLEMAFHQAIIGYGSLEFEWDRKRKEQLGVIDLLPQAGAASYLRANGTPESSNRYAIPEGYLWRRDGEPDSEFAAYVTFEEPVVIPLNCITAPNTGGSGVVAPDEIAQDIVMRVYGLEVDLPSQN